MFMRENTLGTVISSDSKCIGEDEDGMNHFSCLKEAGMRTAAEKSLHGPCSPRGPMHETCSEEELEELVTGFGFGMGKEKSRPEYRELPQKKMVTMGAESISIKH